MAEPQTVVSPSGDGPAAGPSGRRVRRVRGLPGSRAVVGALLVTAAAVGVFAAYLDAVAEPSTRYLVARADVQPGTRLATAELVSELFELQPLALEGAVADRAFASDQLDGLLGQRIVVPLAPGDLLLRSGVVADGRVADAHTMSFAVDPAAALAGRLRAGEWVDVLATYGSGESGWTTYVVRGVLLVAVDRDDGGALAGRGPVTLTVAVETPDDVQALTHAVHTADVVVARSGGPGGSAGPDGSGGSDGSDTPAPYSPSRDAARRGPDPADEGG